MDEDRIIDMVMILLNQNLPYSSWWTLEWLFWWGKRPQSLWLLPLFYSVNIWQNDFY